MSNIKTAISFGLVNIPVILNTVIRDNDTSFNYLHKKCGERIKYVKYCPHCHEEVTSDDLVKGFEYTYERYVTFEEEELDRLKTDEDKIIEIISFVNLKEIDPIYFEKSYYLDTDDNSRAFNLFKKALNKTGKVGIAKTVIGSKSYYAILRFGKDNIIMTTLFYEEEINLDKELGDDKNYTKEELDMAIKLIDSMSDSFKPETYKDEYQDKIKEAIEDKLNGLEVKQATGKEHNSITDLMEALEKSVKKNEK